MFPGMNPRDMQKAMKRLGIKQEEIEAEMVIIKTRGNDLVIRNPHVVKVNMMGKDSLQVSGDIEEIEANNRDEISEDDISTVVKQTSCSKDEAAKTLKETSGNIAEAILKLQNN